MLQQNEQHIPKSTEKDLCPKLFCANLHSQSVYELIPSEWNP